MTITNDLSNFGLIANAMYNSITANATAITSMSVGTANSANLTTTTNVATIGTSAYFVANGNVGIGTASPTAKLDIVGAANVSGNVTLSSSSFLYVSTNSFINATTHYVGNTSVNTNITAGQISISGVTVNSTIYQGTATFANSSSTNTFTIGTSAYFVANGNVGIGTTTPAYKMNVNGTIGIFGDITSYRSASATTGALYLGNGGNYLYFNGTNFETSAFLQAGGSLRAPIFYDSDNTGYYCDPSNESRLNYLKLNTGTWNYSSEGWARLNFVSGDTSYYRGGASNQWSHGFRTQDDVTRWLFEAGGNIYATGNIIAYWSDRRLKKNIKKIDDWRDIINGLNGYRFEWNDIGNKILENAEPGVQIGLIAQEVKAVLPQAASVQLLQYKNKEADGTLTPKDDINYDSEDPYLTVDEKKLIPVLVEAIKGLFGEVEDLKKQLKLLQKE